MKSTNILPDDENHVLRAYRLTDAMVEAGLASSKTDAKRKIMQGAVSVDGDKVATINLLLATGYKYTLKVGRQYRRLNVKSSEECKEVS